MAELGSGGDRVELCSDPYEAAEGAHGLILVTEWHEYRGPDFERLARIMATPALFDGRNQWDRAHLESLGFSYAGIGR
jgi:UDPglucose 6-dehydrogenase